MPIAKVDLSALGTKPKGNTKSYPVLPLTDELKGFVTDYLKNTQDMETLESANKQLRAYIEAEARRYYYQHHSGKLDVESSLEAPSSNGQSLLLTCQNRYKALPDEAPIVAAIGEERTERLFYNSVDVKIDGDKIPADKINDLFAEVAAVFAKFGATDALSHRSVIKPTPEFHTARHTILSVEENLAVDQATPFTLAFKTKRR
jgi:hypothetical protein